MGNTNQIQSRNAADISYYIVGGIQKRPTNWLAALRSSSIKRSLVKFLVSALSNSDNASLFEAKILFANCENICCKFISILDKVVRTEERSFLCNHEETGSGIFFHILSLENQCCNQNSRHRLSYHWT